MVVAGASHCTVGTVVWKHISGGAPCQVIRTAPAVTPEGIVTPLTRTVAVSGVTVVAIVDRSNPPEGTTASLKPLRIAPFLSLSVAVTFRKVPAVSPATDSSFHLVNEVAPLPQ